MRVKESDRIKATVAELSRLGGNIRELEDGMEIEGTGMLRGASGWSHGDHRLAMTLGVAGLLADGETEIAESESASVSYPTFWNDIQLLVKGSSE